MPTSRRPLDSGWRVRPVPQTDVPPHNHLPWLPAQVPGHVHLDLMRAGVIPDPFSRLHEADVRWVDDRDWCYETTFDIESPVPDNTFLVFQGLDTIAEIALNGEPLATTDNMFVPHEFPVTERLKIGANHLQMTFRSPRRVGWERKEAWEAAGNPRPEAHWDWWNARSFVRKAQYMYGWDWGPVLLSCGIWQPVELVTVPVARLVDWAHAVQFEAGEGDAVVSFDVDIERAPHASDTPLTCTLTLTGDDKLPVTVTVDVPPGAGLQPIIASLRLPNPRRWWPNGLNGASPPARYVLELSLAAKSAVVDQQMTHVGLRTIELIREPDADGGGESFLFRVNGRDLFAKGANWIPEDSFPTRITPQRLRQRLTQARLAGFNMLRVWGGGFYESEDFYTLCDELGILVWQDFPYACALYPDDEASQEQTRQEATAAVRRIRHHPSLALWCGNNENDWGYHAWGWAQAEGKPLRYIGEALYHDVLPAVVAAEDPQTPYWPSSPFGGTDPNDTTQGDCHNWDVWHGRGDWVHYPENDARFCSEFGFAASCGLAAWDTCLAPEDKHPHSPAVRWHDKTRKGYDTYLGYINLHFPAPQTLEDLVYYSQLNQAEALKYGVEHYRRRKGHCWGTLFWQFNDCWPVQSWAIVDSVGEPKAAYYACQKFYAPLLLSLVRDGDHVYAHLVNDHLHPMEGMLTLCVKTAAGTVLAQQALPVTVGANGVQRVASLSLDAAQGREREMYVSGEFLPSAPGQAVTNLLLLAEPKEIALPNPGLAMTVTEDDTDYFITLTAQSLAPYVWLRRADHVPLMGLEDNFFHLQAGEMRTVILPKLNEITLTELQAQLVVRTL